MFLRTSRPLLSVCAIPLGSFSAMDLAFYYPRFQPATHLPVHTGLPEVQQAVAALAEGPSSANKALPLLARCQDIFENIGPHMAPVSAMHRPTVAARIQLAKQIPRPTLAQASIPHFEKWVLENACRALSSSAEVWNRDDLVEFDVSCLLLAQFVESFCKLNAASTPDQDVYTIAPDWQCEGWTLPKAFALVEELLAVSERMVRKPENASLVAHKVNSLGWARTKLYLLKSLLHFITTGNTHRANGMITQAIDEVEMWQMSKRSFLDPFMKGVPELGLLYQIQAEYKWRMFDWKTWTPGDETTDGLVVTAMAKGISYYHFAPEGAATTFDPIMDATMADQLDLTELDSYCTCLLSVANFFLSMPHPSADKACFTHQLRFTTSPVVTTRTAVRPHADISEKQPLTLHNARKRAQRCLERALKVNRRIFPTQPNNAKAGYLLLSLACLYADLKDYLFSVGLFNKAGPCFLENYGPHSDEYMLFLMLEAQCLKALGSGKESESRYEKIAAIKARKGGQ